MTGRRGDAGSAPFLDAWLAEAAAGEADRDAPEESAPAEGMFGLLAAGDRAEGESERERPTLRRGSRGSAVRALQQALQNQGYQIDVDGIFGAGTQSAVRAFQARAGLAVDGIAGPATWGRLTGGSAPSGAPVVDPEDIPLGTLVLEAPNRRFSYPFTAEDLIWTAKLLVHEAGGRDDPDNAAVLWAMLNRYALFTHRVFRTFSAFVRAYSTTLQPVLRSPRAAARHAHSDQFVRTGGVYPGTSIPRGQLRRHLDIQAAPWRSVAAAARDLATRALTGRLPNPGIGLASEFASTRIYFRQRHGRDPDPQEWRRYTTQLATQKRWRWVGDVPGLDQRKNAFFLDLRAVDLPPDAVRVLLPAGSSGGEGELEDLDGWAEDLELDQWVEGDGEDAATGWAAEEEDERPGEPGEGVGDEAIAAEAEWPEQELPDGDEPQPSSATPLHQVLEQETLPWWRQALERAVVLTQVASGQRDANELTNAVFFLRHPHRRGTRIGRHEQALAREWLAIRDTLVVPVLLAGPRIGPVHDPSQLPPGPDLRRQVPPDAQLSPLAITTRGLRGSRQRHGGSIAAVVVHQTSRGPADRSRATGYRTPAVSFALDHYLNGGEGFPHYVVDVNGTIYATCDERFVAWHAGWSGIGGGARFRSGWSAPAWWSSVWSSTGARTPLDLLPSGSTSPNVRTIGVELLILPTLSFTDEQYRSLARLVVDLQRRHPDLRIPAAPSRGLLGHEDLTPLTGAHGRADARGGWDPGAHRSDPYFDWRRVWAQIQAVAPGFGAQEAEAGVDREGVLEEAGG